MPPIFEKVYRRTAELDWTEVMTCPHCQAKWKGGVIAQGHGRDRTTYGFGEESAFENAGSDAFARAVDAGKTALLRARCPHCHKRGGGVGSLVVKTVLLYGFLVAVSAGSARLLAEGGAWDGGSSPFLLLILIVLGLALIPVTVKGALKSVDQRVRFEPLQEVGYQPAPPPARPQPAPRRPVNAAAPAPPPPAPAPARPSAGDPDSLELDVDRSWNKKG
ncbi:MAG TPA: hypothetical protein VIG99_07860 [Myxococcaceae bacterium]|jgi:hypothetical protein